MTIDVGYSWVGTIGLSRMIPWCGFGVLAWLQMGNNTGGIATRMTDLHRKGVKVMYIYHGWLAHTPYEGSLNK